MAAEKVEGEGRGGREKLEKTRTLKDEGCGTQLSPSHFR